MIYFFLSLAGLLGGFLSGLIGIGGGLIYVMVLSELFIMLGFAEEQVVQLTIANSFFAIVFASGSSLMTHIKKKEFYPLPIIYIASSAVVTSLITQLYVVNNTGAYSYKAFTLVFLALMLFILIRNFISKKQENSEEVYERIHLFKLFFVGAVTGIVAALSGLGGGVVMMPLLYGLYKMGYFKAKSISLGVIFVVSITTTIVNLFFANIKLEWPFVGQIHLLYACVLATTVMIGGPIGVKVAAKLSSKKINTIYIVFLILFILRKITVWIL